MWFNIKYISSFEHTLWLKHRCYEVLKLGNFKTEIFKFLKVSHPIESREFYINYMIMQVFLKKYSGFIFMEFCGCDIHSAARSSFAKCGAEELEPGAASSLNWGNGGFILHILMYWCKLYLLICQHLRECFTFGSKDYHISNTWLYVDKRTYRIFNQYSSL